jgi:hypothetical protein
MLASLKTRKGVTAEVTAKAEKLQEKLDARVTAVMDLTKQLAEEDPVLLTYYARIFERQLAGHEKAKEFAEIVGAAKKAKDYRETLAAFEVFAQRHGTVFLADQPKITPAAAAWLAPMSTAVGEKSLLGRMAREYLTLK